MSSTLRFAPRTFARAFSSTRRAQIARITLIGRLGAAPELYTTQNGREIIRYSLGVNRGYDESKQTAWWRVSSYNDPGSRLGEKILGLPKGTQLYIEGDVWNSKFEGSEGQQITSVSVAQTKIEILKRPVSTEDGGESAPVSAAAAEATG
ncbi:MAG: hypothetical protein GOMPHAMPRED_007625 [Gomphillus americanus]|uniref:Single-stranded DNA-binding protein n=1 Tax=Gomphillus americanus TaxID=1940652 RepID=A0A8H3EU21_9LECA|nr:MAG: hypothetical protein GOMPHAMPRED_007625 [Gomphillus americanus]